MNRVARRGGIVLIIACLLLVGFGIFIVEYFINSSTWVQQTGSPHLYQNTDSSTVKGLNGMVILDQNDTILLDTRTIAKYSDSEDVRQSTVHWVGDRGGNIDVRTLSQFADELTKIRLEEYNILSGVYTYGDYTSVARLTIDARLQAAAMKALGNQKGTVAILNYQTGEILCAVSTPTFDPDNLPEEFDSSYDTAFYNKFLDYPFAPGSIFKIVTTAVALETLDNVDEWEFNCLGSHNYGGYDVTCEVPHGKQTLKQAFRNSCNCGFAGLAQIVGSDVMAEYVAKFGVTDSLTFDGITTAKGNYDKPTNETELAWSAVGQHTVEIIPASFLNFLGAIARGGVVVEPYIVDEILVRERPIYTSQTTTGERLVSEKTAATLREFMRNNVATKYGDEYFPGFTVCAKTGTAEVGGDGVDRDPNAMFAGFLIDENAPLAFIVCVEDAGYGRTVCVPIIAAVLAEYRVIMAN